MTLLGFLNLPEHIESIIYDYAAEDHKEKMDLVLDQFDGTYSMHIKQIDNLFEWNWKTIEHEITTEKITSRMYNPIYPTTTQGFVLISLVEERIKYDRTPPPLIDIDDIIPEFTININLEPF